MNLAKWFPKTPKNQESNEKKSKGLFLWLEAKDEFKPNQNSFIL